MTTRLLTVLAAFVLTSCIRPSDHPANVAIDPEAIAQHVDVLASNEFEGRKFGTPGEDKTLQYIVNQFEAIGLQRGIHLGDFYATWYDDVPLAEVANAGPEAYLRLIGTNQIELRPGTDVAMFNRLTVPNVRVKNSSLLFVGYGIDDAYRDIDVRGRTLIMLSGAPNGTSSINADDKIIEAGRRGAEAVILVLPPKEDEDWPEYIKRMSKSEVRLAPMVRPLGMPPPVVFDARIREATARTIVYAAGYDFDRLVEAARTPGFRPIPLGLRVDAATGGQVHLVVSHNILALLPGASRPEEYILYLAHWDHLGRCGADKAGDTICNGAVDNASGIGGLIELARAFAKGPRPARSILFLATTAEEDGLLGGKWFTWRPLVPLRHIVGSFGLDTIAVRGKDTNVVMLGEGLSNMDAYVARAAASQGRKFVSMPEVQSFFKQSDHYPLAEAGVPAFIVTGLFAKNKDAAGLESTAVEAYFKTRYHRPSDNPGRAVRFDGAAQDVDLLYRIGLDLANSTDWPVWNDDAPFRAAREGQPR